MRKLRLSKRVSDLSEITLMLIEEAYGNARQSDVSALDHCAAQSGDQDGDSTDICDSPEKGEEVVKTMNYIVSKQVATQQKLESRGMPQSDTSEQPG